jgi:hypothetical protein
MLGRIAPSIAMAAKLPNKSACQGRAFGAPRSGFTLDMLICSEERLAIAIDGSL